MKKLISAGISLVTMATTLQPAAGADLEPYYGPGPAAIIFTWTGFYFGAHAGGAWAQKDFGNQTFAFGGVTYTPVATTVDPSGWLAGGQIGAQYQAGSREFGIGGDARWAQINRNGHC